MTARLKIICKAVLIRLDNGENLDDILVSYPALTKNEIEEITNYVNDQLFNQAIQNW